MADIDGLAFIKRGNHLVAADLHADEFLTGVPENREVLVSIRRPRSVQQHRLFFGLLRLVAANTDQWPSEAALLDDLKLALGHAETRVNLITGEPYAVARSISFASMPQDEFRDFFDRALALLAERVLSVSPDDLRREVDALTGDRRRAA